MPEIPSPLPPKNVFRGEPENQERSPLTVLALQFFVIPLLIVLFCVGLYFVFRWLTYERRDVNDYVGAMNSSSPSRRGEAASALLNYIQEAKRWQSLSDLNDQLRFDREKFLADNPDIAPKLVAAFRESLGKDPKMVRYLSQVLSLMGGEEASSALVEALREGGPPEQDIFVMIALGKLREPAALPMIIERADHPDPGVRYAALFSLGFFDEPAAIAKLKEKLNDPDVLATWNSAFSLARLSGLSESRHEEAVPILKRLMDEDFVRKVAGGRPGSAGPLLNPGQVELYRIRAIQLLGIYMDEGIRKDLQVVAESDPQLSARQAAIDVLNGQVTNHWQEQQPDFPNPS